MGTSGTCAGRPSTCTTTGSAHRRSFIPSIHPWHPVENGRSGARMEGQIPVLLVLTPYEARIASAVFERLFPADENGPGATGIGVVAYLDRALAGSYRDKADAYRLGLAALDLAARRRSGATFAGCPTEEQDALISDLEHGRLPNFGAPPDRKSTRLNSSHANISYAVFCL